MIFMLAGIYVCAMIILAILINAPLKKKYPTEHVIFSLFLLLLAIFIPVLGCCGSIYIAYLLYTNKQDVINYHFKYLEKTPAFSTRSTTYGAGGLRRHIKNYSYSLQERVKALFSIKAIPADARGLLMRDVLTDKNETIRLLDFALLDAEKHEIRTLLNTLQLKLKQETDIDNQAYLHKKLAYWYHELSYQHLDSSEFEQLSLQAVITHAKAALKTLISDYSLWILLAKAYSKQKQTEQAMLAFHEAKQLGAPSFTYVPYQMEYYFLQKEYANVTVLAGKSVALKQLPSLKNIINFWISK